MEKQALIEIKKRIDKLITQTPLPEEVNRELNILYTFYQKTPKTPGILEKYFKAVIKLNRRLNETIFKVTSTNKGVSQNLKSYLLSTTRDIFAVMSVLGTKDGTEEKGFLEEGIALLASQGAELSLLGAAKARETVEVEVIAYEMENSLWDVFRINPKIKGIKLEEVEEMEKSIKLISSKIREVDNPFIYSIGIYNLLVYTYLINLSKKIELVLKKMEKTGT